MKDETVAEKRGVGRPRLYADAAARQRAYRERLKTNGRRVISRIVRDVRGNGGLRSDIIDLSAVRQRR